ncbi:MAG: glycosyltransferase family 4 protein [Syntrophomonadaceae bacterium]|nr:glycosyltransferase family 4 protein [Syntrophomonadaceae bacterium]
MKILHTVESYYPSTGGMQEVVKQISEHLVTMGHSVSVATSERDDRHNRTINGVEIVEFNISGNYLSGYKGNIHDYQKLLLDSDYDVIANFAAQQWATDLMLDILDEITCIKVFVPTGFSALYIPQWADYFNIMKTMMHKYDMNVFLSEDYRDINFARANGIENITVIPNGAAEYEFLSENNSLNVKKILQIPPDDFLILHVGSHTGGKGHPEAIQIFDSAKIRNATLIIIADKVDGGCFDACHEMQRLFLASPQRREDRKNLIIDSLSREVTVAAYKQADLFLFPSHVECSPIVLFECMASKTPFLTTEVGNAEEIIKWSQGGKLLPTIKYANGLCKADIMDSAALLEEIYHDQVIRAGMAKSAFDAWINNYTWEIIASRYESLYESLLDSRNNRLTPLGSQEL